MIKKYLKKIIAHSSTDLQMISACCSEARVQVSNIKYLEKSKIFLLLIERKSKEKDNVDKKINSIIKFEFIDSSRSKNIDQSDTEYILELLAIDLFKKDHNYEIILLFSNNAFITLCTEIIEVTLEDQKEINDKNT